VPKGKVIMDEDEPILVGQTIRLEHIDAHKDAVSMFFKKRWDECEEDKLLQAALPHALVRNGVAILAATYGPEGTIEILDAVRGLVKRSMKS
jgi:hypothetical protein